jgi:TPR repeat protein
MMRPSLLHHIPIGDAVTGCETTLLTRCDRTASGGAIMGYDQAGQSLRRGAIQAVAAVLFCLVVLIPSGDASAQQGIQAAEAASKYAEAGMFRQAEPLYKLAISEARRTRKYDQELAGWLHQLSYVEMNLENLREAGMAALEARSLLEKEAQPRPYLKALNMNMLGRISDFSGHHEQARTYFFTEIDLIDRAIAAEKTNASVSTGPHTFETGTQLFQLEEQRKETVFNVSESFKMEGNWEQSSAWCKKAAEMDLPAAQYTFGLRLFEGRGTQKDLPNAVHWIQKAAMAFRPIAAAQNMLGIMFSQGLGIQQSDLNAVKWYKKAAELGDPNARLNLIKKIIAGKGSAPDLVAAYYWIRRLRADEQAPDDGFDAEVKAIEINVKSRMSRDQLDEVEELLRFDQKIQMMGIGGKLITF